jgi:hypothetical protein
MDISAFKKMPKEKISMREEVLKSCRIKNEIMALIQNKISNNLRLIKLNP